MYHGASAERVQVTVVKEEVSVELTKVKDPLVNGLETPESVLVNVPEIDTEAALVPAAGSITGK